MLLCLDVPGWSLTVAGLQLETGPSTLLIIQGVSRCRMRNLAYPWILVWLLLWLWVIIGAYNWVYWYPYYLIYHVILWLWLWSWLWLIYIYMWCLLWLLLVLWHLWLYQFYVLIVIILWCNSVMIIIVIIFVFIYWCLLVPLIIVPLQLPSTKPRWVQWWARHTSDRKKDGWRGEQTVVGCEWWFNGDLMVVI